MAKFSRYEGQVDDVLDQLDDVQDQMLDDGQESTMSRWKDVIKKFSQGDQELEDDQQLVSDYGQGQDIADDGQGSTKSRWKDFITKTFSRDQVDGPDLDIGER